MCIPARPLAKSAAEFVAKRSGSTSLRCQSRRLPSEYFQSNFYVSTSGMNDHAVLNYCVQRLGAERVMFAIDFPFERTEEAVEFIRTTSLDPGQLSRVTHENAEQLFNIAPIENAISAA